MRRKTNAEDAEIAEERRGVGTEQRVAAGAAAQGMTMTAPARVNLLGEHTDYTGGLVMPMAIPFYTQAKLGPASGDEYRFHSALFPDDLAVRRDDRSPRRGTWSDYPVGVLRELQALGIEPPAFSLELSGNVPFGAGLSSSASVEVATCMALLAWAEKTLAPAEIALLCQRAENRYVGSPCGIMDQFVITAARAEHALLLNTRDLSFELIPMNTGALKEMCIVVCNSEVKHSVATGEYGDRRRQMETGQQVLRERFGVEDLGAATLEQLESVREAMPRESYMRCHHVISENARVREAREAMLAGDAKRMGALMIAAHASQRDDLQTSCAEVDFLVDTAIKLPGCLGARMTGGGFGGCTVNLVERAQAEAFSAALTAAYAKEYGITAPAWVCEAVDGAVARNAVQGGKR